MTSSKTKRGRPARPGDREALEALESLVAERDAVQTRIDDQVHKAREAGTTWQQIADVLGVYRQSAMRKYAEPKPKDSES